MYFLGRLCLRWPLICVSYPLAGQLAIGAAAVHIIQRFRCLFLRTGSEYPLVMVGVICIQRRILIMRTAALLLVLAPKFSQVIVTCPQEVSAPLAAGSITRALKLLDPAVITRSKNQFPSGSRIDFIASFRQSPAGFYRPAFEHGVRRLELYSARLLPMAKVQTLRV